MKIFSWVQAKINEKQQTKKPTSISACNNHKLQESRKEEFADWPNGLLAIGTFGYNDLKQVAEATTQQDLTQSEVQRLIHNELKSFLHRKYEYCSKVEITEKGNVHEDLTKNEKEGCATQSDSLVPSRGKDGCFDKTKNGINKTSFSFLLKKMLICRGGFPINAPLTDPIPESRMEKVLRAVFNKKIYSQSTNTPTQSKNKYLETIHIATSENEEETDEKRNDGYKWVNTDSEYIVLEI